MVSVQLEARNDDVEDYIVENMGEARLETLAVGSKSTDEGIDL